jgi:hypothetical protein
LNERTYHFTGNGGDLNGKPWSDSDTATLRQYAGRESDAEIGARTGHAEVTIRKRRQMLGLSGYRNRKARLMLDTAGVWDSTEADS